MVAVQITRQVEARKRIANSRALHEPVAIVHIPIDLASTYETKLYWTIVDAAEYSEEFFNVTFNTLEIAIFGSTELVNREWGVPAPDPLRISPSWRVFEISTGDDGDGANYDSPHLRHVSAPLSRAGITILYQSSYFTDFLLVKSSDFTKASGLFAEQGWKVETLPPPASRRTSRPISTGAPTPLSPISAPITPRSLTGTRPSPPPPVLPQITVLGSPLACVGIPKSLCTKTQETVHRFLTWPERVRRSLVPHGDSRRPQDRECPRPFVSYTRTPEGSSLVTEVAILRGLFLQDEELHGELLGDIDLENNLAVVHSCSEDDKNNERNDDADDPAPDYEEAGEEDVFEVDSQDHVFATPSQARSGSATGRHIYTPPPDPEETRALLSCSLPPSPDTHGAGDLQISWSARPRDGFKISRTSGSNSGSGFRSSPAKKLRKSYDQAHSVESFDAALGGMQDKEHYDEGEERRTGHKACLLLDCRSLERAENSSYYLGSRRLRMGWRLEERNKQLITRFVWSRHPLLHSA